MKTASIIPDKQQLVIRFAYDPDMVAKVKTLSGRRWNPDSKSWTAPVTRSSVKELQQWGFELSPGIQQWLKDQEPKPATEIKAAHFHRLFPYQQEGVLQIERWRGRIVLGDDPGLGKTAQTLVWLDAHPELRPAVVVCPATIKFVWKNEAEVWMGTAPKVEILKGKNGKALPKVDIYVVNYDILSGWVDELQKIRPLVVIGDECHMQKSRTALRSKAFRKLCTEVPHVLELSGTLILNRPSEGFIPLNIVAPQVFPSFTKFGFRYCGARHNGFGWDFSGATHTEELHKLMMETCYLRRNKADVLKDLPDKLYSVLPMELDNRKEYDAAANDLAAWLRENGQKAKAESVVRAEALVKIEVLKQLAAKGKLAQAIEWIENFLEQRQKLVVFAVHKAAVEALMERFKDIAVKVDGSVSGEDRQKAVDRFQTDDSVRLFVGNVKAAGVGVTLTAASNVAFLEFPWSPGDVQQAEDRCILEGQPILTTEGWKSIEHVTIGDYVIAQNGEPHRVIDAWNRLAKGSHARNTKTIAEISVKGWPEKISVTADHRMLTMEGWREAGNLRPRDRLVMPALTKGNDLKEIQFDDDCRISKTFKSGGYALFGGYYKERRIKPLTEQRNARLVPMPSVLDLSVDAMFVFGYYLGDGFSSITKNKGRFVSLAGNKTKKDAHLQRCARWANSIGLKTSQYSDQDSQGQEMRIFSSELALWFSKHFGRILKDKRIPDWAYRTSIESRQSFLEGLLASDGYVRPSKGGALRYEVITANRRLAADIARLMMSIGLKPCLNRGSTNQYSLQYTLGEEQSLIVTELLLRLPTKTERVYDLTVEEAETFVVGTSVAHNCHRIGQKDTVNVYYLIAKDTIDQTICGLIDRKRKVLDQVLEGKSEEDSGIFGELLEQLKGE